MLRALRRLLGRPWTRAPKGGQGRVPAWALGVGDDAALLPSGAGATVACCDLLVEDVDFRRGWASFADVGHKAAAVNLSDLAAMGATGRGLLLALALGADERLGDVLALVRALHATGRRYGAPLVGGDLSYTKGPMVVSVTAFGEVRPPGLRRHGGRSGDVLAVCGPLGAARAGLAILEGELGRGAWQATPWARALVRRQLRPTPQLAAGALLATLEGVRAATDLSDGLMQDAAHLCGPRCGAVIEATALPLARGLVLAAARAAEVRGRPGQTERVEKVLGEKSAAAAGGPAARAAPAAAVARALAQRWALSGGEDFVLAVAVAPAAWPTVQRRAADAGHRLVAVGRLVRGAGVRVVGEGAANAPPAFDHFRRPRVTPP